MEKRRFADVAGRVASRVANLEWLAAQNDLDMEGAFIRSKKVRLKSYQRLEKRSKEQKGANETRQEREQKGVPKQLSF